MVDTNFGETDVVGITTLNYLIPFGYSYSRVLSFYRDRARRLNNLYLSNNKQLITSYFVEELDKTDLSYYILDIAKEKLFNYNIDQLKEKLTLCANLLYRFYLIKITGHSTDESYSTDKILELIYK
jgi:hypothetical protein